MIYDNTVKHSAYTLDEHDLRAGLLNAVHHTGLNVYFKTADRFCWIDAETLEEVGDRDKNSRSLQHVQGSTVWEYPWG